ncbi:MAG: TRAP transporter small permease [Bacteroidales bacterium]|nr:TRAP transporter small permease [Bacteroidales bacterium]
MIISLFAQVISRYIFNFPIMWTDEIGRYTFIWIVYLGSAVAFKNRTHLIVDVFTQKMPRKLQFYLKLLFYIVIILFLFLVFTYGMQYAMNNMGNPAYSTNIISLGLVYASVPVGALLMTINIIRAIFEDLKIEGKE